MLNFIDGLVIGVLVTIIINKIYVETQYKKYKKIIGENLDKVLKESFNELPIERENEDE